MDRKLHIVYHCFCKNNWKAIVEEHFSYVANTTIHCTAIGSSTDFAELERIAIAHGITLDIETYHDPQIYEHAAIEMVENLAETNPNDFTLYFHSKGSGRPVEVSNGWRNYMNRHFLAKYSSHFRKLIKSRNDATGVLYCQKDNDRDFEGLTTQFFAGNFWIASNKYIKSLPPYQKIKRGLSR